MPIHNRSRYLRVPSIQVEAADGEKLLAYELPQTTVGPDQASPDSVGYVVSEGETFESICHQEYSQVGGTRIWWVLAMCNPHVFYPLDLKAGDVIQLPPVRWVEAFMSTRDDWEETWRTIIRS